VLRGHRNTQETAKHRESKQLTAKVWVNLEQAETELKSCVGWSKYKIYHSDKTGYSFTTE